MVKSIKRKIIIDLSSKLPKVEYFQLLLVEFFIAREFARKYLPEKVLNTTHCLKSSDSRNLESRASGCALSQ